MNNVTQNPNVSSDKKVYWVVRCSNDWTASPYPPFWYGPTTTGPYWSNEVGEIEIR